MTLAIFQDPVSDVPLLLGLDLAGIEDADRTEDLFFVANGPREPAL